MLQIVTGLNRHLGVGSQCLGLVADHRTDRTIHLRIRPIKIEGRLLCVERVGRARPSPVMMLLLLAGPVMMLLLLLLAIGRLRTAVVDIGIVVPRNWRLAAAHRGLRLRLLVTHDGGHGAHTTLPK